MTDERLHDRYRRWAADLATAHPEWCCAVTAPDGPLGYFFAGPGSHGIADFTLVAASRQPVRPGVVVYLAAAHHFGMLGARRFRSALSAANVAALNAHVAMRCRFERATGVWIRINR